MLFERKNELGDRLFKVLMFLTIPLKSHQADVMVTSCMPMRLLNRLNIINPLVFDSLFFKLALILKAHYLKRDLAIVYQNCRPDF